jgi:hypothetical protein
LFTKRYLQLMYLICCSNYSNLHKNKFWPIYNYRFNFIFEYLIKKIKP